MFDLFTPDTTIFFAYTGMDDYNKTVHNKVPDFVSWARTKMKGTEMTNCSFQRISQGYQVRVGRENIDYELLYYCDNIILYNGAAGGYQQWVGIIDLIEWKNPGCYFVYFHIDWYTSMLGHIDYENTYAFIEREHVENDWNGSNPEFSNMGVDEGFSLTPDTPINTEKIGYTFNSKQVIVYSPYDSSAKPSFNGQSYNGIYTSLIQQQMSTDACNQYLKTIADSDEADLANIVSIVSIPDQLVGMNGSKQEQTLNFSMPWVKHVPSVPNYNNAKCWSGEFCQIKLSSGTGQSVSVNTQWFGSNKSEFKIRTTAFINGGDGGIMATFINDNQSFEGSNGNGIACYGDFSVSCIGLPQSPWVGNAYAQWKSANMLGYVLQNVGALIGNVSGGVGGFISASGNPMTSFRTGGEIQAAGNAIGSTVAQIGDITRTIKNAKISGTVIGGSSNCDINTACSLDKFGFQIVMYMCQQYIMKSVDSYFDRFGYHVDRLKKINRKIRPKWTFIKTREVHISSDTGIGREARNYIQDILNAGVTFWRDPEHIGDYSSPETNKG